MSVVHVNDTNFDSEILKSDLPVLVDFWAEWCGPCRAVGPIVEAVAKDMTGKLKVAKINVDEAQDLAARYNIMSIPSLMIFKGGKVVDQTVGAMGKDQLLSWVKPQVA